MTIIGLEKYQQTETDTQIVNRETEICMTNARTSPFHPLPQLKSRTFRLSVLMQNGEKFMLDMSEKMSLQVDISI